MSERERKVEPAYRSTPDAPPRDRAARRSHVLLAVLAIAVGVLVQLFAFLLATHSAPDTSAQILTGMADSIAPAAPNPTPWRGNSALLLMCFALDALAAVPLAFGTVALLPARYRQWRRPQFAFLWLLLAAVPLLGLLCAPIAIALGTSLRHRERNLPIEHVDEPEFAAGSVGTVSYGRGARLKAELQNADAPTSFRMTALLAMQSMPVRTVSPLLQDMLADPLDDIRLLAYGILDNREKQLTQRILAERAKLDGKTADSAVKSDGKADNKADAKRAAPPLSARERGEINKSLAELYGELIYENLVTGDVYRNAADQADAYARAALEDLPDDAALWRLRGRLALGNGELDAAETMLARAIEFGFPRERMLPYLAEAAYLRGDYARVRALLAESTQYATLPTLRPVLEYWRAGGAAKPTGGRAPERFRTLPPARRAERG
ncbi:tetratricopeptide repeat protein [Paraburkholderia acidisoli]|uniref:tetratricopeptide repeat protein n=1 Tax=Paraburkholderia acidisoli TaxID=2571748 RepID=UPI0018EEF2E0|nr:sugar ABC transporter permease [Paraburkholderia acidisoli]